MANHEHDQQEFDRYLQGGTPLSSVYQRAQSEGPTELTEARILAAAKAAIDYKSGGAPFGGYQRMLPASIAALLVITFAVMFINDQLPSPRQQPAPVLSGKVTEPGKQSTLAKTDTLHEAAVQAQLSGAAEKPAAPPVELARNEIRPQEPVPLTASPVPKAAETALADLDQAAAESKMRTETLSRAKDFQETNQQARQMEMAKREEKRAIQSAATTPAGIVSDQASSSGEIQPSVNSYIDTSREKKLQRVIEPPAPAANTESDAGIKLKTAIPVRPAAVWLNDISKLLKDHQELKAKQEWRAFHEQYPDYVIDPKRHADIIRLRDSLKTESNSP